MKKIVTYEDPFPRKGVRQQIPPQPLLLNLSDSQTVAVGLASVTGIINAIRIQDVARDVWYSWDKDPTYPNGYWDNAGGGALPSPGLGQNAPVGQTPLITPGTGNLYIAFNTVNNGNVAGNLTLTIKDASGNTLATQTISTAAGADAGIEVTVSMPSAAYSITLSVTP